MDKMLFTKLSTNVHVTLYSLIQGYAAGNAIPSPLKNVEKEFLKRYWAKWKATHSGRWYLSLILLFLICSPKTYFSISHIRT